jgi:solute carrier family 50 (sugar transporter)
MPLPPTDIPLVPSLTRRLHPPKVGEYSCFPYLVSGVQCGCWMVYALPPVTPCKTQPLVTNAVGLALELFYIIFYFMYAGPRLRETLRQLLVAASVVLFVLLFGLVVAPHLPIDGFPPQTPPLSKQTTVLGFACAVLNTLMYAAPLSVMRQVIRTRSVEFMPLPLSVGGLVCSGCWFVYALKAKDDFILSPNAAGVALSIVQIALYSYYRNGAPNIDASRALISPVSADDGGIKSTTNQPH